MSVSELRVALIEMLSIDLVLRLSWMVMMSETVLLSLDRRLRYVFNCDVVSRS